MMANMPIPSLLGDCTVPAESSKSIKSPGPFAAHRVAEISLVDEIEVAACIASSSLFRCRELFLLVRIFRLGAIAVPSDAAAQTSFIKKMNVCFVGSCTAFRVNRPALTDEWSGSRITRSVTFAGVDASALHPLLT